MKDTPKSSVRDYLEWIRQLDTTVESPERPEKLPGTIMTLNIRHGGGNRVQGILDAVSTHDPDVLILTEFRENKNAPALRKELFLREYVCTASACITPRVNTVFIAAKQPFVATTFLHLGEFKHRALFAQFDGFSIMGLYFAIGKEKSPLFEFLNHEGAQLMGDYGVLIGDFNTGIHRVDEAKATFNCEPEFRALEDNGCIDTWRSRNPDKREFSWYSNKGNGFRIDHAFATPAMNAYIKDVYYSHEEREQGVTDHSAMVVRL